MSYKNPSRKQPPRLSTPVRLGVAAVAACFLTAPVLSNPLNPTVVNGVAAFNQAGNVLTVTNTPGAIINWQKFSIQAGETTHFAQTSASSSVLNRVLNDPTAIYGTLSSNGRVWLVNPAGIMVGPGGRVDVAAFVASTLNISNADFLAGRNVFINDGTAKNVINQGEIRTPAGGSVYLIGSNVTNEGIITTPKGETILAAGATVSLVDSATPGVKVDITGTEGNATNLGTITAEAGRIGIAGVIVRNSGTVNASSVVSEGGRVFLKASQDAYVDGNGRIVTTGTKGGSVEVLGNRVAVMGNAEIDASGTNGGGKILVGGDYQGKNADVQNANVSYFGPNATLKADATEVGDGGTVIVWADDTTRAYGNISARGGAAGGNGGFVETSGKNYLAVDGIRVDTRAPQGKTGTWLLDPSEIFITGGGPTTAVPTTVVADVTTTEFTTGVAYGSSTISDTTINTMLDTTDVIIHTAGGTGGNGNINVTNANIFKPVGGMALTLAAYGGGTATGNIIITNSNINVRDGVTLLAGWNGAMSYGPDGNTLSSIDVINGKGDITIAGSMIQSSEWAVNLWAGRDIRLTNSGTVGTWIQAATMDVQAGNNLTLESTFSGTLTAPQGPGVALYNTAIDGPQTIKAGNQILLQAGSANNTVYGGNNMAGAGVGIFSDGDQTISAKIIKLYAGVGGHDNSAGFQAHGSQTINVGDSGGGLLELKGGDGAGSYNNQARIQHGQWIAQNTYIGDGDQTITIYGGGTVNVIAGSGTGVSGYYGSDCSLSGAALAACRGSSNNAIIENGFGAQKLDFLAGGTLYVKGGNAGRNNWASIENNGYGASSQEILGSPNITLYGGDTGGTAVSYGGITFELSNDAGIYSDGAGDQYITANTLIINGGNATYGGAGISNDGSTPRELQIVTTGDMSMYGGTSNAAHPHGAAVYIHSEAGGPIILNVGGNLYAKAGSGSSAPVIIGSVDGRADVEINVGTGSTDPGPGNVTIIANGSGVGIGSMSDAYGAEVYINARRAITVTDSATKGVIIGSLSDTGGTFVSLSAGTDINIGTATGYGALIGVMSPTTNNEVHIHAGGGIDFFGGNVNLYKSSRVNVGSDTSSTVNIGAAQTTANNGNITQYAGSGIYGGDVGISGGGNVDLSGTVFASNFLGIGAGDGGEGGGGITFFGAGFGGGSSLYGGNLYLRAGSNLSAPSVDLTAKGTFDGQRGEVNQYAGSIIAAGYDGVSIAGGGNVMLNGSIDGGEGSVTVKSGFANGWATRYGGNISVAGTITGDDVDMYALSGYSSRANGNITQSSGSITSDNGSIRIFADGDVKLNGLVDTPNSLYIGAGVDNDTSMGSNYYTSEYGGNVELGAASRVYGGFVDLRANGGYNGGISATGSSTGNITQVAGGQLTAETSSLYGYAAGNVELLGSTIARSSTYIYAGRDNTGGGGLWAFANKHITLNSLDADDSSVNLRATGPISANTTNASSIYATINNSSSGGIAITNSGSNPSYVNLEDNASNQSTANFTQNGDLIVGYGGATITMEAGDLALISNGNMTIGSSGLSLTGAEYGSILIGANGNMLLNGTNLFEDVDVRLAAGGSMALTNNAYVHGENLVAAAGQNISLAYGSEIGAWQKATLIAGIDIRLEGSYIHSDYSDVVMNAGGDIRVNDGSSVNAANSVYLTMKGSTSTVYVNDTAGLNHSSVSAGSPTTVNIEFLQRSSGGVVIDGVETTTTAEEGSGFYANYLPATTGPGGGLVITYANSTAVVVDPCASNPDLCKPPTPIKDPMLNVVKVVEADPCASAPDSAQCKAQKEDEENKGEQFGDEGGKKDDKSTKKVAQCGV